tara:strand:- start:765 stop:1775 length:1011 start_codon:yes stop_codon:yes gene_type:complete
LLATIEEDMAKGTFWDDRKKAEVIVRQSRDLKDLLDPWEKIDRQLKELNELHELAESDGDVDTLSEIESEAVIVATEIGELEFRAMLNDPDDSKDAILVVHSGAGGTEAADWAEMLMRMYNRWIERNGFQSQVMDLQPAEEAGIKGATIEVTGQYAYGHLKAEAGVHRLVRISPFDANKRRHTSFASIFVYPEVEEIPNVEFRDDELQYETFKAGGAGGQHVNKTSSAVRLTHLPTGISVQCQNERSQFKNKGTALKVLTARVYQYLRDEEAKKQEAVENTKKRIEFGSQIRSYVMHPYNLVKDHRTGYETGNVQAVIDGQLDAFIKAYLTQSQTA